MKQILLEQWTCDCGFQFFTKGYPEDLIVCPSCEQSEGLGDGQTFVAQVWAGEELK